MSMLDVEDEVRNNERRQQHQARMDSVCERESGNGKYFGTRSQNEPARRHRKCFQGHDIFSEEYLNIGKAVIENALCGAINLKYETVKASTLSDTSF